MLKTCSNCGQNFLTEADLFVYQQRPTEEYYSCGCKEQADVAAWNPVAQKELDQLRQQLAMAEDAANKGDEARHIAQSLTDVNEDLKAKLATIERDTAEKCAKIAKNSCLSPPDGGSPTQEEINDAEWAAHLIRKHFNLAPNKL